MSDDIEWMWLFLLRDGHDSLTGEEQIRLAHWLRGCPSDRHEELRPETESQADHALDYAKAMQQYGGDNAVVPVRLVVAAYDIVGAGSMSRRVEALVMAAQFALPFMLPEEGLSPEAAALVARVRALTPDDVVGWPDAPANLVPYGEKLMALKQTVEAEAAFRLTLHVLPAGQNADLHARTRENLAVVLPRDGDSAEVERLFLEAIDIRDGADKATKEGLWRPWLGLSQLRAAQERLPEAEQACLRALQAAETSGFGEYGRDNCRRELEAIRATILHRHEGGRLFGWALRGATGDPFIRACHVLPRVAGVVDQAGDSLLADEFRTEAARLQARAGYAAAVLTVMEEWLTDHPRGEGFIGAEAFADALRTLVKVGRREEAQRFAERSCELAASADSAVGDGTDLAQRSLVRAVVELNEPASIAVVRSAIDADKLNILREHDLERAVERRDLAALRGVLAEWVDGLGLPNDWLLHEAGELAVVEGDQALVSRVANLLALSERRHLGVLLLLAADREDEAEQALSKISHDGLYATGLSAFAAHHALKGDCARFKAFAERALSAEPPERERAGSMLIDKLAEGARACWSREQAEAWSSARLGDKARREFLARLDPARPRVAVDPVDSLPALSEAIASARWDEALVALRPDHVFWSDVVHGERLAVPAAAAGRLDVAIGALEFALDRLAAPLGRGVSMDMTLSELRFRAARRLGECAHRLLPADRLTAFGDHALAKAAMLTDAAAAAATVVAGGLACRPDPAPAGGLSARPA